MAESGGGLCDSAYQITVHLPRLHPHQSRCSFWVVIYSSTSSPLARPVCNPVQFAINMLRRVELVLTGRHPSQPLSTRSIP